MHVGKIIIVLTVAVAACGGTQESGKDFEKAFAVPDPHQQAEMASDGMAKMKEKAAAEAKTAGEAEWQALLVVPADAPTKIDDACEAMLTAYDGFMQKRLSGPDLERWNAVKQADLDSAAKACRQGGDPKVPACQANVFALAPLTYDETSAPDILEGCRKKFGSPPA